MQMEDGDRIAFFWKPKRERDGPAWDLFSFFSFSGLFLDLEVQLLIRIYYIL